MEKNKEKKFSDLEIECIINTLTISLFKSLPKSLIRFISNVITDDIYPFEIRRNLLTKIKKIYLDDSQKTSNIFILLEEIWKQLKPTDELKKFLYNNSS